MAFGDFDFLSNIEKIPQDGALKIKRYAPDFWDNALLNCFLLCQGQKHSEELFQSSIVSILGIFKGHGAQI